MRSYRRAKASVLVGRVDLIEAELTAIRFLIASLAVAIILMRFV